MHGPILFLGRIWNSLQNQLLHPGWPSSCWTLSSTLAKMHAQALPLHAFWFLSVKTKANPPNCNGKDQIVSGVPNSHNSNQWRTGQRILTLDWICSIWGKYTLQEADPQQTIQSKPKTNQQKGQKILWTWSAARGKVHFTGGWKICCSAAPTAAAAPFYSNMIDCADNIFGGIVVQGNQEKMLVHHVRHPWRYLAFRRC